MAVIKSPSDPNDTDSQKPDRDDPSGLKSRGLNGEKSQKCCEKICEEAYRAGVRDGVNSASAVWTRIYEVYSFVALTPLQRFIFGTNDPDQIQSLVARLPSGVRAPVEIRPAYGQGYIEGVVISPGEAIPAPTFETVVPGDSEGKLPVVLDSEDPETLVIGYSEFYQSEADAREILFAPQPLPLEQVAQKIMPRVRTKLRKKFPCRKKCSECTKSALWGQNKPQISGKFINKEGEVVDEKRRIRKNTSNS